MRLVGLYERLKLGSCQYQPVLDNLLAEQSIGSWVTLARGRQITRELEQFTLEVSAPFHGHVLGSVQRGRASKLVRCSIDRVREPLTLLTNLVQVRRQRILPPLVRPRFHIFQELAIVDVADGYALEETLLHRRHMLLRARDGADEAHEVSAMLQRRLAVVVACRH